MLGKVRTSPQLLSTNDYLLFPDEECENAAKVELMATGNIYQINNNNLNNFFLHINISSVSYHIDDLNTCIMNYKNKHKVIGISECRIKTGRPPFSNINMNKYSYEYTPTESSKGGTLLYIDRNLRDRSRSDLTLYNLKKLNHLSQKSLSQKRKTQLQVAFINTSLWVSSQPISQNLYWKNFLLKKGSYSNEGLQYKPS